MYFLKHNFLLPVLPVALVDIEAYYVESVIISYEIISFYDKGSCILSKSY